MGANITQNRKYVWLGFAVIALIALNIIKYSGNDSDGIDAELDSSLEKKIEPEDLRLVALDEQSGHKGVTIRNIFESKKQISDRNIERKKEKMKKIAQKAIKEIQKQPTKEELNRRAIDKELQEFHFIGSVMKGNTRQAFLLYKEKSYIADPGLVINGHYQIEKINETSVVVKHQSTGISKTLVLTDE